LGHLLVKCSVERNEDDLVKEDLRLSKNFVFFVSFNTAFDQKMPQNLYSGAVESHPYPRKKAYPGAAVEDSRAL
jgi:hypothetical protein